MQFLKKLFSPRTPETPAAAAAADAPGTALLLLLDGLPDLAQALSADTRANAVEPGLRVEAGQLLVQEGDVLYAELSLDGMAFKVAGFAQPAPESAYQRALSCAHASAADKLILREHRAHILVMSQGEHASAAESFVAALRLSGLFLGAGLLGVVDNHGWNVLTARAMAATLTPSALAEQRSHLPLGLWAGFVKLFKSDREVWFATKGLDRWNCPNFAMLGAPTQAEEALSLFTHLSHHVRSTGARLAVGHTLTLGDCDFQLTRVSEHEDFLGDAGTTLVLQALGRRAA